MTVPKNYFPIMKTILKFTGLSLSQNNSIAYKFYSFFYIFILHFCYPILGLIEIFKHPFEEVTDSITYEVAAFIVLIKGTVTWKNRLKINKILQKLEEPPFAPNPERGGKIEEKLMTECVKITNIQAIVYWSLALLTCICSIIFAIYKRLKSDNYQEWVFPYGSFTHINATYSPNYELALLYQCSSMVSLCLHFIVIDVMTATILAHVSYQFKILKNFLRILTEKSCEEMIKDYKSENSASFTLYSGFAVENAAIPWKYLKKSLQNAVNYHLDVLELVDEFEEIFSGMLFLVLLSNLGMMSFNVYFVSQTSISDPLHSVNLLEYLCMCIQILSVCYWGEQIKSDSEEVNKAVYESNFVGTDLRFQKGLIVILRSSQRAAKVTALKFTDICLATFVWTVKTSYSAFMVLYKNNMKEQQA